MRPSFMMAAHVSIGAQTEETELNITVSIRAMWNRKVPMNLRTNCVCNMIHEPGVDEFVTRQQ